jgi:signal transduction histidine kinase
VHSSVKKATGLKIPFIGALLFLGCGIFSDIYLRYTDHTVSDRNKIQENLHTLEKKAESNISEFILKGIASSSKNTREQTEDGISYMIFKKGQLKEWSDNAVDPDELPAQEYLRDTLLHLDNGWYEMIRAKTDSVLGVALVPIQNDYAYQNKYLVNSLNPYLTQGIEYSVRFSSGKTGYPILNRSGDRLFSIDLEASSVKNNNFPLAFYLPSALLFFIMFHIALQRALKKNTRMAAWMAAMLILARILTIFFHFPASVYKLQLFSPSYYASSFFLNSLGDLIINVFLCIYLLQIVVHYYEMQKKKQAFPTAKDLSPVTDGAMIAGSYTLVFAFAELIHYLLSGLILNSQINFNFTNVFDLNYFSFSGFLIAGALLYGFYVFADRLVVFVHEHRSNIRMKSFYLVISVLIYFVALVAIHDFSSFIEGHWVAFFLAFSLVILNHAFCFYKVSGGYMRTVSFSRILVVIIVFSMYLSQTFFLFNRQKESEHRKMLALKIQNERDYILEHLFAEMETSIQKDKAIEKSYEFDDSDEITANVTSRLRTTYLSGYPSRYDLRIYCFDATGEMLPNAGENYVNKDYFIDIIRQNGRPTYSPNLHFIENESGKISYLFSSIIHTSDASNPGYLIISAESRVNRESSGFPELFISNKVNINEELLQYSYARYKKNRLISQTGKFSYYLNPANFGTDPSEYVFTEKEGYSHLLFRSGSDSLIVISKQQEGILSFFTLFSYFFAFFCVFVFMHYLSKNFSFIRMSMHVNFQSRIQLAFMFMVFILMMLMGGGTIYYLISKNKQEQKDAFNQKTASLLLMIENELGENNGLNEIGSDQKKILGRASDNISLEYNIFNEKGLLVYSTEPRIYEQGIVASRISASSLLQKVNAERMQFSRNERTGNLQYLSVYEPIKNLDGKKIGYLNLPFFTRESELQKEISSFAIALINIYILLFTISLIIVFIISNRITQPLRMIQERLKSIRLGAKNEPIQWKNMDEIGELVAEYNKMVEALSSSAEKLARSEREFAWREMAKQVAHEIKNPLTPMKLSIQHLERAHKANDPNLPVLIERFSKTLIEQIDALSSIAGAFSNFAQMPASEITHIDIEEICINTLDLFKGTPGIEFIITSKTNRTHIWADRNRMLSVMNNLVKNAIQSIKPDVKGKIHLTIEQREADMIDISVSDNGTGIPAEMQEHVFTPNFTTKSTGSGLGLTITRNIVEGMNGSIRFETTEDTGTTFHIRLPLTPEGLEITKNQ